MTLLETHNRAYAIGKQLDKQFHEQLAPIDPNAIICYHSHYSKFTISIYAFPTEPSSLIYSTDFLDIYSHFEYSDTLRELAFDITEYITKEQ